MRMIKTLLLAKLLMQIAVDVKSETKEKCHIECANLSPYKIAIWNPLIVICDGHIGICCVSVVVVVVAACAALVSAHLSYFTSFAELFDALLLQSEWLYPFCRLVSFRLSSVYYLLSHFLYDFDFIQFNQRRTHTRTHVIPLDAHRTSFHV